MRRVEGILQLCLNIICQFILLYLIYNLLTSDESLMCVLPLYVVDSTACNLFFYDYLLLYRDQIFWRLRYHGNCFGPFQHRWKYQYMQKHWDHFDGMTLRWRARQEGRSMSYEGPWRKIDGWEGRVVESGTGIWGRIGQKILYRDEEIFTY